MRPLSTRQHGLLDHALVLLLLAAPWALFASDRATWLFSGAALVLFVSSALARHELALRPLVPIRWHLMADVAAGVLVIAAAFVVTPEPLAFRAALAAIGAAEGLSALLTDPDSRRSFGSVA